MTDADVIPVGKFAGTPITKLPQTYLRHLVQVRHGFAPQAQAELERRGAIGPGIEVTGHAVDRASLCATGVWRQTRTHSAEGLQSWLVRITQEALAANRRTGKGLYVWAPLLLAIDTEGVWPLLKTVVFAPLKARPPQDRAP